MAPYLPVFGFYPDHTLPGHDQLLPALNQHGLSARIFHDLAAFPALQASGSTSATVVAFLAGGLVQNCRAARFIRALDPCAGILAFGLSNSNEADQQALYHNGVDIVCPATTSNQLAASMLYGLARRGLCLGKPETSVRGSDNWVLQNRGWLLVSPDGKSVSLTTTEHDFFQALIQSSNLEVARNLLIKTIWSEVSSEVSSLNSGRFESRLTITLTRLRRKVLRQTGSTLPLQTVHGWGYIFTARLVQSD